MKFFLKAAQHGKTIVKWTVAIIAALAIFTAVAGFILYWTLYLPPVQSKVLSVCQKQLEQELGQSITIGSLSTNLFTSAVLHNVRMALPDKTEDSLVIHYMKIEYVLPFLLVKRLYVKQIGIRHVDAMIVLDTTGKNVIIDDLRRSVEKRRVYTSLKNGHNEKQWEINVNRVKIEKIHAFFRDDNLQQSAFIRSAGIEGAYHHKKGLSLSLKINGGQYVSNWWLGDISMLKTDVTINESGLKVSNLIIQANQSKLLGKGLIPFTKNGTWDLSVSASTAVSALPVLLNALPDLSRNGSLTADASWSGSLQHPVLKAFVTGNDVIYGKIAADSLMLNASYSRSDSAGAGFMISGPVGSLSGEGTIIIDDLMSSRIHLGKYSATVHITDLKPDTFISSNPQIAPLIAGGICSGIVTIDGSGSNGPPENVSLYARAYNCALLADTLKVSAVLSDTLWNVSSHYGDNTLFGQGSLIDFRTVAGSFSAVLPSPFLLTRNFIDGPTSGTIQVFADVKGAVSAPDAAISWYCYNGVWKGFRLDSAMLRMQVTPEFMSLDTFSAHINTDGNAVTELTGKKMDGTFSLSVEGKGDLLHPDATVLLNAHDFSIGTITMDSVTAQLSVTELDSLHVQRIRCVSSQFNTVATIAGTGSIQSRSASIKGIFERSDAGDSSRQSNRIGSVQIDARAESNDSFFIAYTIDSTSLAMVFDSISANRLSGTVSLSGTASGTIKNPVVAMTAQAHDFRYKETGVENATIHLQLIDSLLTTESSLFSENRDTIFIEASVPFIPHKKWKIDTSGVRPLSFSCNAERLPLDRIVVCSDSGYTISGFVALSLEGRLKEGKVALSGMASVDKAGVISARNKFKVSDIELNMIISGSVDSPRVSFSGDAGPFSMQGGVIRKISTLGVADRRAVDFYSIKMELSDSGAVLMDGRIPFGKRNDDRIVDDLALNFSIISLPFPLVTSMLSESIIQGGILQGKGAVRVINGKPDVRGNISLSDGLIVTENINPSIGPVDASIQLAGDSIIIRKVNARWGKGTIKSHGTILFDKQGMPSVDVAIKADNIAWNTPDVLYGAVDHASLHCKDNNDNVLVTGKIDLGATRYIQDLQLTDLLAQMQSGSVLKDRVKRETFADKVLLNVNVDLQENASVDINLGSLKLDGNCILSGTAANPTFIGEIDALSGNILYLDRKFEISQAKLSNYDPKELSPVINLEATADILSMNGEQADNHTIQITLKGDMKNPVFTLKDETGNLNELEIISILTLGQPLGGMSGDMRERLTAFVSQSLLGFGSRKLEQFFGIEKFDVKGDIFDGKQVAENTKLTIAKRVTPRLMVLYESDIGKRNRPKISALFRLANNIFLSGETDNEGESGVDIIFKYSK